MISQGRKIGSKTIFKFLKQIYGLGINYVAFHMKAHINILFMSKESRYRFLPVHIFGSKISPKMNRSSLLKNKIWLVNQNNTKIIEYILNNIITTNFSYLKSCLTNMNVAFPNKFKLQY